MDVRFSSEQQDLRASVVRLVDRLGPRTVADLDDAGRAVRLEETVSGAGWRELRADAGGGAPLASAVEVCIVAEELGRGLADVAFAGPTLAADLRRRVGAAPATAIETVALDQDLSGLATAGSPDAVAVDCAGAASALVLEAGGARLLSASVGDGGVQLDLTRRTASGPASPATGVDSDAILDDDDRAAVTALGLAMTCADLVGVMRGAITLARDYAVSRRQYDAPVGSFQAVQHLLADAHVAMEGARSVALHAAWAVDALPAPEALAAGALSKAFCARAARSVCEVSVQVHGGIGNTWDCLAHVFLRRALLSIELFGGADANVGRVLAHSGIGAGSGHGLR